MHAFCYAKTMDENIKLQTLVFLQHFQFIILLHIIAIRRILQFHYIDLLCEGNSSIPSSTGFICFKSQPANSFSNCKTMTICTDVYAHPEVHRKPEYYDD